MIKQNMIIECSLFTCLGTVGPQVSLPHRSVVLSHRVQTAHLYPVLGGVQLSVLEEHSWLTLIGDVLSEADCPI